MFGDIGTKGSVTAGDRHGGVATLVSADGLHWGGLAMATSMQVAADTANNALYDPNLGKYVALSRNHCQSSTCNESGWGLRRETFSTADSWSSNNWTKATESLHGEHGYEIYSMAPFRAPHWTAGLYLGVVFFSLFCGGLLVGSGHLNLQQGHVQQECTRCGCRQSLMPFFLF